MKYLIVFLNLHCQILLNLLLYLYLFLWLIYILFDFTDSIKHFLNILLILSFRLLHSRYWLLNPTQLLLWLIDRLIIWFNFLFTLLNTTLSLSTSHLLNTLIQLLLTLSFYIQYILHCLFLFQLISLSLLFL